MNLILSKDHGVNPSISACPVCGQDGAVVLFGGALKTEAPMRHKAEGPCSDCCQRFDLYLKENIQGFILLIVANLYDQHQYDRNPPSPWLYFKAAYFTDLEAMKHVFKDVDLSHRKAWLSEATALHIGIDLNKLKSTS